MKKKTTIIILTLIVVIFASFGGYRAYASHLDYLHYQEARGAINKLYSDKNHKILSKEVNEAIFTTVQKKIDKVDDKDNKLKLNKLLKTAKYEFKTEAVVKKNVSALFKNGILQDNVSSLQIEKTQVEVNQLEDKTLQTNLQKKLDEAKGQLTKQINAQDAVTALFVDTAHTKLVEQVNRDMYNHAKQLADLIRNEKKKKELTDLLVTADTLLSNAEKEQSEAKAKEEERKKMAANVTDAQSTSSQIPVSSSSTIPSSTQQETGFAQIVANTKTAQRTDQIITVVASGTNAKITLLEKNNGSWTEVLATYGFVGSQGVGQAYEGSEHTPRGAYTLGFAFGQTNPGTQLPFRQITQNSYWISDVNSDLYNTWQEGSYAGNGNEHLADYANLQYYYAIVINYNESRVKGAGSAFFLHVSNGRPTAGCVSVPKSIMEQLMKRIHPGAFIINVTSQNEVSNY
ncbi:MAG: toxin Cry1Ac domain D-VI-related protein [Bacillota bacterium]|nr:toxin Cry1Ac domain D-VI-related protein [Bacillota bacterium]